MNIGRKIARDIQRWAYSQSVYGRLQTEAASRPESRQVQTPAGLTWMSPIEFQLYEAMRQEGLDPVPQFYIQGYYADFAFPDVRVVVEADGAAYHDDPAHRQHDRKRDWILHRAGWTVKRFHGTTIYHKASNCAYVVKREVEGRRMQAAQFARQLELKRQARREALLRPFRTLRRLLTRDKRSETAPSMNHSEPRPPKELP